jgi:predicted ATPase
MRDVIVVRVHPQGMGPRSEQEESRPSQDMANFASWYRHLVQERPRAVEQAQKALQQVLNGFVGLRLSRYGKNSRELRVEWELAEGSGRTIEFDLDELSDGQRALVALYTLIHAFPEGGVTLCLDEPDNFVALSELQPWLGYLEEKIAAGEIQALFISHHPELINELAVESGVLFSRESGGPVRIRPFQAPPDMPLTAAELIARGWEDEQT